MSASRESIIGSNDNGNTPPAHHARLFGQDKYTVEQVAWALRRNSGLILPAARTLQCSQRTIHSYIQRYPELEQVKQEARKTITNVAEVKLIEKVRNGDNWAVSLWLKTQAGYSEKNVIEHTGANGGSIKIEAEIEVKMQHEIVAGMVRGHLENGYALAEALKNVVLLGIPKTALSLLTKADLQLSNNGSGTYEVLSEENNGNSRI